MNSEIKNAYNGTGSNGNYSNYTNNKKAVQSIKENNSLNIRVNKEKENRKINGQVDKNYKNENILPPIKSSNTSINNNPYSYLSSRKESGDNLEEITNMMKKIIDEN